MKNVVKKIVESTIQDYEWYVEPFLGECDTFSVIKHPRKVGCDINQHIITLWKNVQENSIDTQIKTFEGIKNSLFINTDYKKLIFTEPSFIYCNPPHVNSKKKKSNFNSNEFWEWCEEQVYNGNVVLVNEHQAPSDFICIWQEKKYNSETNMKNEKLFVHVSQLPFFNVNNFNND